MVGIKIDENEVKIAVSAGVGRLGEEHPEVGIAFRHNGEVGINITDDFRGMIYTNEPTIADLVARQDYDG